MEKLTTSWCQKKELKSVECVIDYNTIEDGKLIKKELGFESKVIPPIEKHKLESISLQDYDIDDGDPYEVQEKFNELLVAQSTGLDLADILAIKKNKPHGVWDAIVAMVNKVNSTLSILSAKEVEEVKNSDGQEQ